MASAAPVLVRAYAQGLTRTAVVVAGLTIAGFWTARRLRVTWLWAALASAAIAGVVLRPSFGLALGAFLIVGLLSAGWPAGRNGGPICWTARVMSGLSFLGGTVLVAVTPRVTVAVIGLLTASALSLIVDRLKPPRLEATLGPVASRASALWADVEHGATVFGRQATALSRRVWGDSGLVGSRRAVDPWLIGVAVVAAALATFLAIRDQRLVLFDDAAITFRYALRIAEGHGFTYNPGDRTNGASAPLYTLILALGHRFGADLDAMARVVGVLAYAFTVGLVVHLVGRLRGIAPAAIAALLLVTSLTFREQSLNGMESGFAAALGILVVTLLVTDRQEWAGAVLGLALVNKLDAGAIAAAVAIGYLIVHRRPPWRTAATAAAVAAPWFLFSLLYFGSPIPHSAAQKVSSDDVANPASEFSVDWILDILIQDGMGIMAGIAVVTVITVAVVSFVQPDIVDPRVRVAVLVAGTWGLIHGTFFSLVDLGDTYPWYSTVLFPPLVTVAVLGVFLPWSRVVPDALTRAPIAVVVAAVLWSTLWSSHSNGFDDARELVREERDPTSYELFEATRRDAGLWLHRNAEPGDVVKTCYGWVAFGAIDQVIKETCPLSTRDPVGEPTWIVKSFLDQPDPLPDALVQFDSPGGGSRIAKGDDDEG